MKKRIVAIIFAITVLLLTLCGCGEKKELTCDHCGEKVLVSEKSNMEEDWIVYCEKCNEELFSDDPVLGAE